jgi:hypothetical protein
MSNCRDLPSYFFFAFFLFCFSLLPTVRPSLRMCDLRTDMCHLRTHMTPSRTHAHWQQLDCNSRQAVVLPVGSRVRHWLYRLLLTPWRCVLPCVNESVCCVNEEEEDACVNESVCYLVSMRRRRMHVSLNLCATLCQ